MLFLHSMAANRFQLRCQEWQGHHCCSGGWVLTLKGKGSVRVILVFQHLHRPQLPDPGQQPGPRAPPAGQAHILEGPTRSECTTLGFLLLEHIPLDAQAPSPRRTLELTWARGGHGDLAGIHVRRGPVCDSMHCTGRGRARR